MPIYTRFGDSGETRLFDGSRVPKSHLRVCAYGEVDELNSALGVARAFLPPSEVSQLLVEIQQQLMAVGAALANPEGRGAAAKANLPADAAGQLEQAIDRFEAELPALRRFVLPGGSPAGAHLHLARTICRRAERRVVQLSEDARVDGAVLEYLNRLSDLLFVLARAANYREGMEEVLW